MFVIVSLSILALCTVQSIRLATNLGVRFAEFVFFSTFGLIFGLAPVLQSKDCYASEFGLAARNQSAWFALFGFVMLACGFALARKSDRRMAHNKQRLLEHIQKPQTQRFLCCFFWASVLITIFSQFLMMHSRGITISDLLNSGRFAHRFNNQGLTTVLSTHLTSFAYVPAFVGVFLNRKHQYILLAYLPLASLLFFYVFAKGTRSIPLAMLMTTLVAGSIRYRFSPQKLMLTVGAGSVGLLLAIGLYELREQQDSLSFAQSAKLLLSPKTYETMWDRDPLGYGANLVGAVATFPDAHPYLDAATYRRMLVFYLQESRFPHLKPPDSNILFGLVVHQRDEALQVTSPPSILGDVWINFWGWWGLPALFLHGWLYCWLLQRMQTSLTAFLWVGPLIGRFLVLVHRGEPYEMFVLFFMFFFAVTGVAAVCRLAVTKPASRRHHRSVRVAPRAPRRLAHACPSPPSRFHKDSVEI